MLIDLKMRADTATRVPKGKHLNLTAANTVVNVITNSRQMQTPHGRGTGVQHRRADTRLSTQKQENLGEIFVEGLRCKIAVLVPPLSGKINLTLRPLRDADLHGLFSRDDEQASRALLRRTPFRHAPPRRWKAATLPLVQA